MAKKKKSIPKDEPNFEECLEELSSVVTRLESGELSLDDSLQQYELGVRRLKACYSRLSDAERRIELISGVDSDGETSSMPFDESASLDMMEDGSARSRKRSSPPKRSQTASKSRSDDKGSLF